MALVCGIFFAFKGISKICSKKKAADPSVQNYNKMQKFNSQFTIFAFLRIIWLFMLIYCMLNMLKMSQGPDTIELVGGIVGFIIVLASFVYITAQFARVRKFDEEKRKELSCC